MAETLGRLGSERAWVVHGQGLDEIALSGETQVAALENGLIREFKITPEDAGLKRAPPETIRGGSPEENAAALTALLGGQPGAYRDIVLLNAAAALVVAEKAPDLRTGALLAARAIDSGAAAGVLARLQEATS
jgi:anthranilate phosphoribosyltransferase